MQQNSNIDLEGIDRQLQPMQINTSVLRAVEDRSSLTDHVYGSSPILSDFDKAKKSLLDSK